MQSWQIYIPFTWITGYGFLRKVKLTAKKYFNQCILNADGRFVRDPQYLHIAQYALKSKYLQDQIRVVMRKVKDRKTAGKDITGLLRSSNHVNELYTTNQAYKFMKNVKRITSLLAASFLWCPCTVWQLGCPTLPAEDLHWPELITLIANERGKNLIAEDISNLTWEEKCNILRENSVTAARQFNYRIDIFSQHF